MELECSTGKVNAKVGDRYTDQTGEWEIVGFREEMTYSPSIPVGVRNVTVKPIGHPMPSYYQEYANEDGTLDLCGDSIAAQLLTDKDGKPRDARGYLLTTKQPST